MSMQWLHEAETRIHKLWTIFSQKTPFFWKLKVATKAYRIIYKDKVQTFRVEEKDLREALELAIAKFDAIPNSPTLQQSLLDARPKMKHVKKSRIEGKRIRSKIQWKHAGNCVSTRNFKVVRE